jgi:Raf kinase inhibitor-like YbhB/YbcL family protein
MTFRIESSAFKNMKIIPRKYTCDGEGVSPPLAWKDAPEGTRSFALICDDPDAPLMTYTHWVMYNIPATVDKLPEGSPKIEVLESGAKQGMNSGRRLGYAGPCPPGGKAHRYYFKIFALDADIDLRPGASKKLLEQAMKRHVLAQADVMGTYARSK